MKIGIDVQSTKGQVTGLGNYTRQLVHCLGEIARDRHQFILYSHPSRSDLNTPHRLLWENAGLYLQARNDRVDLLHVPAFSPPFLRPAKVVVTVHDLIGMLFANQMGWPSRFYWGKWLPCIVARADAVIADSEHTKKDILRHLGVPEEKIRVIYPSGHEGFHPVTDLDGFRLMKKQMEIRGKYFLCVGTVEPRKNFRRVIRAFRIFLNRLGGSSCPILIVAGSTKFGHGKAYQFVVDEFRGNMENIRFTGYLEHEVLNMLYGGAEAFVYPSLYEGFGMPVLEAMAAGTPVLTSKTTSLPEVAGDAALLVDPENDDEIADGLLRIYTDPAFRRNLVLRGFERIKMFSWHNTAAQTLKLYETLA